MTLLLNAQEIHFRRTLSRWALVSALVTAGVLTVFGLGTMASQGSALPPAYDELVWASRLPALYRAATTFDLATWLGLGGFFALTAAGFTRHAPIRSIFIALCGVGQLAGAIGAFSRLLGVSALAAQYGSAAPDQLADVLRAFLDLQLAIGAHFATGSLLWSIGLLLVASAAWPARVFPRWLVLLIALTGVCNLTGDIIGIVGVPLPFGLFILPLVLLASSLFGVAAACSRQGHEFPRPAEAISAPDQEAIA